jgi:hypothetical protein
MPGTEAFIDEVRLETTRRRICGAAATFDEDQGSGAVYVLFFPESAGRAPISKLVQVGR